ncbi:hypothetical protein H0H81_006014 [Sphagnurus paluster]|uniref:Uncharacterized protein n=1 Tax=Sphagnurus paluster TaxID=117069 RepID=A0A9P7GLT9_9AGAR|nr:hypothetical protein H0H81_006014 [Sphagnurus paluster]
MNHLSQDDPQRSSAPTHVATRSQDTSISRIAESAISYGELAQFPQPPTSIPSTPVLVDFGTPSPSRSAFHVATSPVSPQRRPLPVPGVSVLATRSSFINPPPSYAEASNSSTRSGFSGISSHPPSSLRQPVSPYDWHDGASSMDIDPTEDRLLPTSFITSLLKENTTSQRSNRVSYGSDAFSGFSEMTYPPLASTSIPEDQVYASPRTLPQRHPVGRAPPSAFASIRESPSRLSNASADTLFSTRDQNATVLPKGGVPQGNLTLPVTSERTLNSPISTSFRDESSSVYSDGQPFLPRDALPRDIIDSTSNYASRAEVASRKRESLHSTKTTRSLISRISSHRSIRRIMTWRRVKPLPPVPLIPHIPIATEMEHRRREEMRSLPDLANRANALQSYLEKGYHPHDSVISYPAVQKADTLSSAFDDGDFVPRLRARPETSSTGRNQKNASGTLAQQSQSTFPASPKKKRICIILGVFFAVCLAAVGTAVGITLSQKKGSAVVCQGALVGAACNLNSTCVCTSSLSGQCSGLAQNIVDLIPIMNEHFYTNYSNTAVYNKIWLAQGAVPGSCASQSLLIDVAPALTSQGSEALAQWSQTAILWTLVESQDLKATASLQKFIQGAPWKSLNSNDASPFVIEVAGYSFNFATREVRQPDASFMKLGQPTSAQFAKVGPHAHSALDRMYGFASASSTQHTKALENYWTTVLQQKPSDLSTFISAFSVSPILLPFDATLTQPQPINTLLTTSTSSPFPPPLGCYPGLKPSQVEQVNAIEDLVFGLSPLVSQDQFDPTCYPDRPIYGVLDVLRLRLPFIDPRPGIARQAAILKRDVSPRVILRSGALLSPLPGPSNVTAITTDYSDPRQYGALGQFNHVVLRYLLSIPKLDVATALVAYVLSSASVQATPPPAASILYDSLDTIPIIEVAVFGSITPSDISSTVSSFTTSSGALFFGSDQGAALRNWAIAGCSSTIAWAESSLSPVIVRDKDFTDQIFNQTWLAVSTALQNNIGNIGLINVTDTFTATQKFTPF